MASNILLTYQQFQSIQEYEPVCNNHDEKQTMKHSLLQSVKSALIDKWDRLAYKTVQALDFIFFLAAEKGYVYASYEYLAEKHGCTPRHLHKRLKELVDLGLAIKTYRRSPNHNGLGKPVYFFTEHPLFEQYRKELGLTVTETQAENQAETQEIPPNPFGSKDTKSRRVSTYINTKHESDNKYPYSRTFVNQDKTILALFHNKVEEAAKYGRKIRNPQAWFRKILDNFILQEELKELKFKKAQQNSASVPEFVPPNPFMSDRGQAALKSDSRKFMGWLED